MTLIITMTTNRREIIISSLLMQGSPKETKETNKRMILKIWWYKSIHSWVIRKDTLPSNNRAEIYPVCQGRGGHRKEYQRRKAINWNIFGNSFYSKEMQRILCMSQPGNNGRVYEVHRNKGLIIPQRKLPSKKQMPVPLLDNIHYCKLSGRTQQQAYKYLDFKVSIEKNVWALQRVNTCGESKIKQP